MNVKIPTVLAAYTGDRRVVEANGATIDQLLADLDRRYPGIRFRMVNEADEVRPHMRIFVNGAAIRDLAMPLSADDEVIILQALSGG